MARLAQIAVEDPARAQDLKEMLAADAAFGSDTGSARIQALGAALVGTLFAGRDAHFEDLGFRPLRLLGRGGMGEVWLVARRVAGRTRRLALKLLQPLSERAAAEQWLQRFQTEQQILLELDHPGIARLIDAGDTAGQPWIAMEYVAGMNIVRWCDEQRLDVRARIGIFRLVCDAVQYAHDHLVVHRDIKPANVLVGRDGQPKLLDFGIAKLLNGSPGQVNTGTAQQLFSLYGVAPEQLQGQRAAVGTDVYALGALLYELLCGRPALRLDDLSSFAAIEARVLHESPDAPSVAARRATPDIAGRRGAATAEALARLLRGDLDRIVLFALRKLPAERYPSVREFSADLGRWLNQEAVHATGQSRTYRTRKFLRRHRLGVAIAAMVFAVLLAFIWQLRRERDAAEIARDSAQRVSDFMVRMFETGDPTRGDLGKMTVTGLIRQGIKQLRDEELDPRVSGKVLTAMSRAANGVGDLETLTGLLEQLQAMDAQLEVGDRIDRDLLRFRDAMNRQDVALRRTLLAKLSDPALLPQMSPPQRERAALLHATNAVMDDDFAGALAIIDARRQWTSAALTSVAEMKLIALKHLERHTEAERYARWVLGELERAGASDLRLAQFKVRHAEALAALGDGPGAERGMREALAGILSAAGAEHALYDSARFRHAQMHMRLKNCRRAVAELGKLATEFSARAEISEQLRFATVHNLVANASVCPAAAQPDLDLALRAVVSELANPASLAARGLQRERLQMAQLRLLVLSADLPATRAYSQRLSREFAAVDGHPRQTQLAAWQFVLDAIDQPPATVAVAAADWLRRPQLDDALLLRALESVRDGQAVRWPMTRP